MSLSIDAFSYFNRSLNHHIHSSLHSISSQEIPWCWQTVFIMICHLRTTVVDVRLVLEHLKLGMEEDGASIMRRM